MAIDVDDDIVEVSNGSSKKRELEEENGTSAKKPRFVLCFNIKEFSRFDNYQIGGGK